MEDGDSGIGQLDQLPTNNSHLILTSLTAGAFAGALAKTTIAPLDRTKIYFQTTPTAPFSTRTVLTYLVKTYKTTGFFSLYRGNSATMARIVPYSAIQFASHEQYKRLLTPTPSTSTHTSRFICGSLAGVTAQSLTYPLDLCRARLAVSPSNKYKNLGDVFVKIITTEGPATLFRGFVPTMIGVIPYAGCSFYTYETCKKFYREEFGEEASGWVKMGFGAVSGVIGQTSSYPFDIVRRRRQVGTELIGGSLARVMVNIARTEGVIGGLYKGLSMNWIKGPVSAGISFSVFDYTSLLLRKYW